MKLKPYPKYKDSGIQWIGEIPEGWEAKRYKIRFKYVKGKIPENLEETNEKGYLPYLSMEYLRGNGKGILCANDPKSIKVSEGDLLLLWDGSNAGEFVLGKKGYLSSTMVKLNVENFNSKFSWYLCKSFEPLLRDLTIGMGIPHVNGDTLGNIRIPVPNSEDQTAIANFLDKKTARIDALIEKDKRLIKLLKERRTALINHAVTKGLDPDVKMKKANLLTCDESPENWRIVRIKFVIRLSRGVDLSSDDFEEGNIPVYGSNGIIGYHNKATSKGPGVTVGRSGSVGEVNFANEEKYWAHNTSLYLQENYGNNVRYIYYLLSILDLKHLAAGSAVGTLNRNYIHDLFVSLPSKQEQQKIVEYLDKATSKIDKTIQKIEKKIKLLEEYKKSLIHHVVTGKVNVKGVEA